MMTTMPAGMEESYRRAAMVTGYPSDCDRTAVYAVTVTTKMGDQEVTKRYEAPTAEEAMRMAGERDMVTQKSLEQIAIDFNLQVVRDENALKAELKFDDDTVEIVTLQTVAQADTSPV